MNPCSNCQCNGDHLHHHIPEVYSDIAKHECICIFEILYSSYPRMHPSCPLSASLVIISTTCMILFSDYVFDRNLTSTERRAFCSLYKCVEDMNHQCECVVYCKLSKGKLPRDTKIDNVHVRSYPRIRTPTTCKPWLNQSLIDNEWGRLAKHRKSTA